MTTPKSHGVPFKAPLIRAFLRSENPKTQTRRVPTAANSLVDGHGISAKRWAAMNFDWSRAFVEAGASSDEQTLIRLTAKESFETLWQSVNGLAFWRANPPVWVYDLQPETVAA